MRRVLSLLTTLVLVAGVTSCTEGGPIEVQTDEIPQAPWENEMGWVGWRHNEALRAVRTDLIAVTAQAGSGLTKDSAWTVAKNAIIEYFDYTLWHTVTEAEWDFWVDVFATDPYQTAAALASIPTASTQYPIGTFTAIGTSAEANVDDQRSLIDNSSSVAVFLVDMDGVEEQAFNDLSGYDLDASHQAAAVADSSTVYWNEALDDWAVICDNSPAICVGPSSSLVPSFGSGPSLLIASEATGSYGFLPKINMWQLMAADATGALTGALFSGGNPTVAAVGGAIGSTVNLLSQAGS